MPSSAASRQTLQRRKPFTDDATRRRRPVHGRLGHQSHMERTRAPLKRRWHQSALGVINFLIHTTPHHFSNLFSISIRVRTHALYDTSETHASRRARAHAHNCRKRFTSNGYVYTHGRVKDARAHALACARKRTFPGAIYAGDRASCVCFRVDYAAADET